jgi:ribosomal protein S1
VKLADGRVGVIDRSEFRSGVPSGGDSIDVALLAREDSAGRVALSRSWALKQLAWDAIEKSKSEGTPVNGTVTSVVKGGLVVDLGLRAFLPASLVDDHPGTDLEALVGQPVDVIVTEVDRQRERVVVSRRDHIRKQKRAREKDAFAHLQVGQRRTGTVVAILDFGLQIDVDGAVGLLHRSEISWTDAGKPSTVAAVGESIEVLITEVSKSKRRLSLSLRRLHPDPLESIEVGSITTAVVTRVLEYGVFAQLDGTDVIGLVHMTEMSDLPGYRPDQLVTVGEPVQVKVLSVDFKKRRVALSIRQALWA